MILEDHSNGRLLIFWKDVLEVLLCQLWNLVLELHNTDEWRDRVQEFHRWCDKMSSGNKKEAWTWEGKDDRKWKQGSSKCANSVPASPADRPDPFEEPTPWTDLGPANIEEDFLYPRSDEDCPVARRQEMSKPDQVKYMAWIEKTIDVGRKGTKDKRLYCAYCDMNNRPRLSCKHLKKHRDESAPHRCTLCIARHAAFKCKGAQCNGGCAKPNWARQEFKLARTEERTPDFRWERDVAPPPLPPPAEAPPQERQQQTQTEQQSMCAAAAIMHGLPPNMHLSSSRKSAACPPIHENPEWAPTAAEEVQYPQPGYRIPANIWTLDIRYRSAVPGPMASFLPCCYNAKPGKSKLFPGWSTASPRSSRPSKGSYACECCRASKAFCCSALGRRLASCITAGPATSSSILSVIYKPSS